ncbi:hypothetical protein PHYSODRAFT_565275 [Phytophthora sojae]|uniref:SAC domain-containing protein n=1 Tax=Phytophthora sojae (strain P6497) TaxID=1094619 RepID=G5AB77_PHYSP|nr:hypothetical protein PHYSODRAFT_565275 [Phytophthora sojae]EGZ07222.1 hypothetical protein PHYSODRAFT_565275 [Phytophthora sojae]|eukprot:XP_009536788.1 hypothetical protein PHYSODRAFT_565275 [Phytophthora sojae]
MEWVAVDRGMLSRLLYPNPVCLLSVRSKDGGARSLMTITWLTAINNQGGFICSMNATRHTAKFMNQSGAVFGTLELVLAIGGSTGADADKFEQLHVAVCAPGGGELQPATSTSDDQVEAETKKRKLSKKELARQEIANAAAQSIALQDCVAHLLCRVETVTEDDGHLLLRTPGPDLALQQVAVGWGVAATLATFIGSPGSGAHLNPAVTLAIAISPHTRGGFQTCKIPAYMLFQLLGATFAGLAVYLVFGSVIARYEARLGLTRGSGSSSLSALAFGASYPHPQLALGTLLLVLVQRVIRQPQQPTGVAAFTNSIAEAQDINNEVPPSRMPTTPLAPFYVGATLAALTMVMAPFTQACLNPARDFGPRVVAAIAGWGSVALPGERPDSCWVYLIGPMVGALYNPFATEADTVVQMPPPADKKKHYELVVQDDFLVVLHPSQPLSLQIPRSAAGDASLGLSVEHVEDFQHVHGRRMAFDAIYGVFWLLRGPYLAVVTQSKLAARGVGDAEIRLVQKLELLLIPTQNLPTLTPQQEQDEQTYIDMITTDIEKQKLHFAKHFDLTHSLQRIAAFDGKKGSIAERADDRFFWNKSLCSAFLEQKFFEWVTPMVQAHIEVTEQLKVKDKSFRILYISRRSCKRQGMRFTMRGIDDDGNVANFVETEQICLFDDGKQTSFVQIRGSIPVFWSSPVTMKYAPKVYQAGDVERNVTAFQKHAYELMSLYGRVLFVNLIDKKKEQLKLGEAMAKTVTDAATKDSHILAAVRLVWFDFHRECRNMKWGNLEKLIKQVDDDFLDHGYFCKSADGAVVSKQSGVVRTNCMDNLDRTNVVQSLFGRRSLMLQLNETEALQGNVLNSPFEDFERTFKRVWGNNADAISLFYAGTGALKTDFTRTGKRTKKGALMDGYNSCVRYIMNNFMDGYRQDVLDLLLGRFSVSRSKPSPFQTQGESLESVLTKLMGLVVAFFLVETYRSGGQSYMFERLFRSVLLTLLICTGVFSVLVKKGNSLGKKLVRLPSLRPQDGCMTTWKR